MYFQLLIPFCLTLSVPRGTDGSFQPVPNITIVLLIVTALPHQVELQSSIESWGQNRFSEVLPSFHNSIYSLKMGTFILSIHCTVV